MVYFSSKYLQEHSARSRPKGSLTDRIKGWEKQRQEQLNTFKKKWEKDGGAEEPKTIKRETLRSTKGISENQIKGWESERLKMLDGITTKYKGGVREPIKRQTIRMGTSVSDKDLHDYEQERQKMMERIRSQYT